jgi:hypothetical protein
MELTANTVQNVKINQNVLFTEEAVPGNCSIIHREGSGLVTLRGLTQQSRARFKIMFNANIAVPTGETAQSVSLAIAINGEPIASTTMISTPGAAGDYNNISSSVFLDIPAGCCS